MTTVLTATAQDIVNAALRLIGEIDANQSVSANDTQDTLQALNYMIKSWQNQGLHLWTKTEGILFLDAGKTDYLLGPSGDEATNVDDLVTTDISIAGVATDTTINVDSTAGMTVADTIGIRLDDGTRQWTTISTIPDGISVTIPGPGLTGATAIDNSVFTFTSILDRPLRLLQLRRDKLGTTEEEIEAEQWSREEYFAQPDKTSQGTINNWYYSPQLTNGRVYLWQTANDVDQVARFTYERPIEITLDTSENPDFPAEWFRTLKYNLAVDIAPEYRIPQERLITIKAIADELLEDSLGFDFEPDSLSMQPDMGR
ncbi:MAG: hypothetical protein V3U84_10790 [Thiotrichaceae bacterium]